MVLVTLTESISLPLWGRGWSMRPIPALAAALGLAPTFRPEWFVAPSGRVMGVRSARMGRGQRVYMTPGTN